MKSCTCQRKAVKTIEWGFLIVNYLFLGGLSAGLFFVSALATYLQKNDQPAHSRIARYAALMAPWPLMVGCLLLVFDLGHWYRFYKLFLHFRWVSAMSIGSWLLVAFNLVSLLYCYAWLTASEREWLFAALPRPPLMSRLGAKLSQELQWRSLFQAPKSGPPSASTVCTAMTSMPSRVVASTPRVRRSFDSTSKAGWLPWGLRTELRVVPPRLFGLAPDASAAGSARGGRRGRAAKYGCNCSSHFATCWP